MTMGWSVRVELRNDDTPDAALDTLTERLAAYHASVGIAPSGNVSAQMTVDATTARQALDAGLKAATTAAREAGTSTTVLGIELMTEDEFDRRLDEPSIPELAGTSEIADILGDMTRQRAGQIAAENDDFPPAVSQLKSGPVFIADQVRAFKKRWPRIKGRPRKTSP
jgi:hypothetical protein